MAFYSTRELAEILNVSNEKLMRAVWLKAFPAPAKGPGGSYYWAAANCECAARYFWHRGFDELLAERAQRETRDGGAVHA